MSVHFPAGLKSVVTNTTKTNSGKVDQLIKSKSAMSARGWSGCGGQLSERNDRRSALEQPVVLRRIFGYLSTKSLLACSLVNLTWSFEARSFIRDFRTCRVLIRLTPDTDHFSESSSDGAVQICKSWEAFATVISTSINPTCINGLKITFSCEAEVECSCLRKAERADLYRQMLERMTLKSLVVTENCERHFPKCRSVELVRFILKNSYQNLENLQLDPGIILDSEPERRNSRQFISADDIVMLPRLTTFGTLWYHGFLSGSQDFALKLFTVAPNLKEIDADIQPETISENVIPDDKLSLVKRFELCITEEDDEYDYLNSIIKLADAKPYLKTLSILTPWKYADFSSDILQKCVRSIHQLIHSSQSTLEDLKISLGPTCTLVDLQPFCLPRLSNLTTLEILLIRDNPRDVFRVLSAFDYDEKFPVLESVTIAREYTISKDLNLRDTDELEVDDSVIPDVGHCAISVSSLTLDTKLSGADIVELGKIYPNVRCLSVHSTQSNLRSRIPYSDIWATFPDVEELSLYVPVSFLKFNYDSVFLGIGEEEVCSLQHQHGKFLRSYQFVPSTTSLTSLKKLKKLRLYVDVVHTCDDAKLAPPFLSTAACFLAFERLPNTEITIILFDDKVPPVLHHLRQFCSLEFEKHWKYHPSFTEYELRYRNCSKRYKYWQ